MTQEVSLRIVCRGSHDHPHRTELLLWPARNLTPGGLEGVYLKGGTAEWESGVRPENFKDVDAVTYLSKTSPRCPVCTTNPRITGVMVAGWLAKMLEESGGRPFELEADIRDLPC